VARPRDRAITQHWQWLDERSEGHRTRAPRAEAAWGHSQAALGEAEGLGFDQRPYGLLAFAPICSGVVAPGVVWQPRPSTIAEHEAARLLSFRPCPGSKPVPALRHVDRVPNVVVRKYAAFGDGSGKRPSVKVAHALGARAIGTRHDVPPRRCSMIEGWTPKEIGPDNEEGGIARGQGAATAQPTRGGEQDSRPPTQEWPSLPLSGRCSRF
jgi:hypothetical protein